jgi:hypothetical protein
MPEAKEVGEIQDTNVTPPAPASMGDKAHVDAVLKKAAEGTNPNPQTTDLLAGKFKTKDDLLKGITAAAGKAGDEAFLVTLYKSLETRIGQSADKRDAELKLFQDSQPKPNAEPSESAKPNEPSSEPAGDSGALDFDAMASEYAQNGKLSDESYSALEKQGFNRNMVDVYIEGVKATTQKLHDRVGGTEKYKEMIQWSVQNIPVEDQQAFDKGISSGSEAERMAAVDTAWKRYVEANGQPPAKRLTPQSGDTVPSVVGFASYQEMVQAMKDPRYGKDPAYERWMMAKLKVSRI